ncbi:hypothetical protein IWX49DRAFT_406394 [Phyllosticta citricarpa]|uniref:Uncharacterized protein n=2 Tax=Phyllosticta TaxID=121621 RepID=A0ABR1L251_9PEZI
MDGWMDGWMDGCDVRNPRINSTRDAWKIGYPIRQPKPLSLNLYSFWLFVCACEPFFSTAFSPTRPAARRLRMIRHPPSSIASAVLPTANGNQSQIWGQRAEWPEALFPCIQRLDLITEHCARPRGPCERANAVPSDRVLGGGLCARCLGHGVLCGSTRGPSPSGYAQVETATAGCLCHSDRQSLCPRLHHDVRCPGGFASPLPCSPSPPASSYAHELRVQVVAPLLNFKQASRVYACAQRAFLFDPMGAIRPATLSTMRPFAC